MSVFLGIIGCLGALVSIVFIIINVAKKKPVKVPAILLVIFFVMFVIGLSIPSPETAAPEPPQVVEEQQESEPIEIASEDPEQEEEPPTEYILEAAYEEFVLSSSADLGLAFETLGPLLTEALFTDEWVLDVALQIAIIQIYCEEILATEAPEKYKETHELYKLGAEKYYQAMDYLTEGIDNIDGGIIELANKYMDEGIYYLLKAAQKLEELQ